MGFRFRRSVKILPGIRLNFGTRGISTSIGVRGAHVTFGRTGVRTTVGLPGSGLSYTHLEKPGHAVHVVGGPGQPTNTDGAQGSALRGWMWIALITAVVVYAVDQSMNTGPSVQVPAAAGTAGKPVTRAAIQGAPNDTVAEVKMAALGVEQIRRKVANSKTLKLAHVAVMPDGAFCYKFQLQNSRGIPYTRTAVMNGAVPIASGSEGFISLWNSRCARENEGRDITAEVVADGSQTHP